VTAFAEEIRAAAQALLTQEAVAAGRPYRVVRDNWGWPLASDDLPALAVFMPRETMTPDGSDNSGEPSFVHDCTLGVIISLGFAQPEDLKDDLKIRVAAIYDTLLTTVGFRLPIPGQVPLFESFGKIEETTVFDQQGETFIVEGQLQITIRFRSDWPPVIPDDFETLAVTLKQPGQPTPVDPTLILNVPQETTP